MIDPTRPQGVDPSPVQTLLFHLQRLVQKEIALLRAEMSARISKAAAAAGLVLFAVVIALTALHVLAGALVAAIAATGLAAGWAALIVGGGLLVVALIAAMIGIRTLSNMSLAPRDTLSTLRRDAETLKETLDDK
ncbi:phage holin family protein [Jannaschia sp. 2305UL9-9]|uniref:phage holin family protein n=1 Tax=Jannaschia sp. 2305UL9-9 TaxID=3121638 RepID=UPI0035270B15